MTLNYTKLVNTQCNQSFDFSPVLDFFNVVVVVIYLFLFIYLFFAIGAISEHHYRGLSNYDNFHFWEMWKVSVRRIAINHHLSVPMQRK